MREELVFIREGESAVISTISSGESDLPAAYKICNHGTGTIIVKSGNGEVQLTPDRFTDSGRKTGELKMDSVRGKGDVVVVYDLAN